MIQVNGREVEYKKNETVRELLKRMKYTFPNIVVKINGKLVKRDDFENTIVPDNSKIDAIHMISGG